MYTRTSIEQHHSFDKLGELDRCQQAGVASQAVAHQRDLVSSNDLHRQPCGFSHVRWIAYKQGVSYEGEGTGKMCHKEGGWTLVCHHVQQKI